jgi:hypothetical protein
MSINGNSFGAVTGGLRRLLVALAENAATLPDVTVERHGLEVALTAAEVAKNRQDAAVGNKQLATQELQSALASAKDAAIRLQSAARFALGPRSEKLVVFQVKPLRKRGSRAAARLRKQEEELRKQEAGLLKKEMELRRRKQQTVILKKQVELLRQELDEPVDPVDPVEAVP